MIMKKIVLLLAAACLSFCAVQAQNYTNAVLTTSNLLGYWRFSADSPTNSSFGTNTGAFSGNAAVGPSGSGPALAGTSNNTAVLLDGNGSFVTTSLVGGLNTNGPYANQGSLIAWFKLATLPSIVGRTFFIAGESVYGNDFDMQIEPDNRIRFYTDGGSFTGTTNALTASDTNVWHFVAVTFTASTSRKVYLDGVLAGSSTPGGHNPAVGGTFSIGDSHVFTGRFFQGALDEVAIFNRELTGAEVANLYAGYSSVPVFTPYCTNLTFDLVAGNTDCTVTTNDVAITNGLVAWYKADGDASDSYGTNNGTLVGGANFVAGQSGQAFNIQAPLSGKHVNAGNMRALDNATGITVSAFLKVLPTTNDTFYLFSQGVGVNGFPPPPSATCVVAHAAAAGSFLLVVNTNKLQWKLPFVVTNYSDECPDHSGIFTNVSFDDLFYTSTSIPTNQWVHLSATWRNSDGLAVFYVNGIQVGSTNFAAGATFPPFTNNGTSLPPGMAARTGSTLIGAANFDIGAGTLVTLDSLAAGQVDNLRVYSRALSSGEIQQIMQADSGAVVTNCATTGAVTTNLDFCTTPKGKLQILNAAPNNVQLSWPSQTSAFYLLQGSDELAPLNWTTVWGAQAGNGSNINVFDPTTPRPKRFYRLLSTEQ